MPVLHKYKTKDAHYILTSINNSVITFQLTDNGFRKINSSGIAAGDRFERALLLDLYRTGDAFTYGTGVTDAELNIDEHQLALDFADDPTPEQSFPSCGFCSSLRDLHLVEISQATEHIASIQCSDCRAKRSTDIDTSIPLPLVSRTLLGAFLRMKQIDSIDDAVESYRKMLNEQFAGKWEAVLKAKSAKQASLLDTNDDKQGSLL